MLLSDNCEIYGLEEGEEVAFVARDTGYPLTSVVGRPSARAIGDAVVRGRGGYEVVTPPENRAHVAASLPGWETVSATLHMLGDTPRLPRVPAGSVRLLEPSELDSIEGLPSGLRAEFAVAVRRSPIAASFADGRPVAFCYAVRTESLWDISINTLEGYRKQGHAARCVAYMIEYLRPLRPVWGAEETNLPSLRLAARLGFVPVDELLVFRAPRLLEGGAGAAPG
jgi:GNAT superfamily N-acetyltransferase